MVEAAPFEPRYGEAVEVEPGVVRVTARNRGPFTGAGTNSYVVGSSSLAVIDPGPDDAEHLEALKAAIGGRPVTHIVITHTHADHSPLAARLVALTGATTCAEGPHRAARRLHEGETNALEASADRAFRPDRTLAHGERIEGNGWALETVLTPGHTANHSAFALEGTGVLFSGDHIMGWSTTIVAPPDGSMKDYMDSLETLLARDDRLYLPGHGGAVEKPQHFVRAVKGHRLMREGAILDRLRAGDRTIAAVVAQVYRSVDARLHGAAALSVLAHLEALVEQGRVVSHGPPSLHAEFEPAGAG